MTTNIDNNKFIFVCGLHRSGTSLLHKMLCEHTDISGFKDTDVPEDEGQHLQTVFPAANKFGGPGKFCFDNNSFMDENHNLATKENAEELFKQWSKYWDLDKKYLIEKSPPNIIRSRFFQKLFPNSHFIFITRNPIAVSMATQKWSNTPAINLYKHWNIAHKTMLDDVQKLDKYIIIKYEDLVSKPDEIISKIFSFLNLETTEINQSVKQDVNKRYFDMWNEYMKYNKAEKFKFYFTSKNIAKKLGY